MATNAKKKLTFLDKVLREVNKDEKTVQKEVLSDRIEDFQVECAAQISLIKTSQIPGLKNDLARAKRDVIKAKNELITTELDVISVKSFEEYISRLNNSTHQLTKCEAAVSLIESNIEQSQTTLEGFEAILERLKS